MATLLNRLLPGNSLPPGIALESDEAVLEACRASLSPTRSLSLIPEPLRDDIALVCGVCRLVDEIGSAPGGPSSPGSELARLEAELLGEVPGRPLVRLAMARLPRLGIDPGLFRFLIAGVRRELDPVPVRDDDELLCYVYCVAGVVGVVLSAALGLRGRALLYAVDLGIGLQLTNIARKCLIEAARGRCYVPVRRLTPHDLTPQRLIHDRENPEVRQRLRPALEGLLRLGDHYYRSAEAGAAAIPLRYRYGLLLLGRTYRREGWRSVQGTGPGGERVRLPIWERALLLSQVTGLSLTPRVAGLLPPLPHDWRLHTAFAGNPGTDPVAAAPETSATPSMASRLLWRRRGTGPVRRTW